MARDAPNPWAAKNAELRKARERQEQAKEPYFQYYVVPQELLERVTQTAPFVDLASAADLAGCQIHRAQKRGVFDLPLPPAHAIVYEGAPGRIFLARQNW